MIKLNEKSILERRKRWQSHNVKRQNIFDAWCLEGFQNPPPQLSSLPYELHGMTCGAKAKSTGQPCRRKDLYSNGRCKLHGGLSTGPLTNEGKRKSAKNGFRSKKVNHQIKD